MLTIVVLLIAASLVAIVQALVWLELDYQEHWTCPLCRPHLADWENSRMPRPLETVDFHHNCLKCGERWEYKLYRHYTKTEERKKKLRRNKYARNKYARNKYA